MKYKKLPGKLFTIGYSGFDIQTFVDTINDCNINVIMDVRSSPYSSHFPEYNADNLKNLVSNKKNWKQGIAYYVPMKESFGARQTNPAYFSKEKFLDFEKFQKSKQFLAGCTQVLNGLSQGYNIVLLCAEREPSHCHRAVLITRWFDVHGYAVTHILPGTLKVQSDVDEELLQKYLNKNYMKNMQSGSLLALDKSPEEIRKEDIEKAYRKQNREIGFRQTEEE
ncbi:MAG: DUF488 domain-containing protein [Desulfovibrionaceae bacterium]|nr:DUF488 domain-containing protein [Desulfovibrionaceae bacterium]